MDPDTCFVAVETIVILDGIAGNKGVETGGFKLYACGSAVTYNVVADQSVVSTLRSDPLPAASVNVVSFNESVNRFCFGKGMN